MWQPPRRCWPGRRAPAVLQELLALAHRHKRRLIGGEHVAARESLRHHERKGPCPTARARAPLLAHICRWDQACSPDADWGTFLRQSTAARGRKPAAFAPYFFDVQAVSKRPHAMADDDSGSDSAGTASDELDFGDVQDGDAGGGAWGVAGRVDDGDDEVRPAAAGRAPPNSMRLVHERPSGALAARLLALAGGYLACAALADASCMWASRLLPPGAAWTPVGAGRLLWLGVRCVSVGGLLHRRVHGATDRTRRAATRCQRDAAADRSFLVTDLALHARAAPSPFAARW